MRLRMWSFGSGCSATQALTRPRSIQAKTEVAADGTRRPIIVNRIPAKMKEPAAKKPATRREREVACCATGGHRPRTMPQRKAAAIATAGSFTGPASSARAFRCETFVERDQTGAFLEFDSGLR